MTRRKSVLQRLSLPDLHAKFQARLVGLLKHLRRDADLTAHDGIASSELALESVVGSGGRRLPVGDTLHLLERDLDTVAAEYAADVFACADMVVDHKLRHAVLERDLVVQWWPLPIGPKPWSEALWLLMQQARTLPPGEPTPPTAMRDSAPAGEGRGVALPPEWPAPIHPKASNYEVAQWARDALNRVMPPDALAAVELPSDAEPLLVRGGDVGAALRRSRGRWGDTLVAVAATGYSTEMASYSWTLPRVNGLPTRIPAAGLAALWVAEQEVKYERDRPVITLDAGKAHHGMLIGVAKHDKSTHARPSTHVLPLEADEVCRLELLPPSSEGSAVQLALPSDELSLQGAIVPALFRLLKSHDGVRQWAVVLRMLTEAGRTGLLRWTMADHLEQLQLARGQRGDLKRQQEIAALVELFTKLELVAYNASGTERTRNKVLETHDITERLRDSRWLLDGVTLRINPLLYGGVRHLAADGSPGNLGTNFVTVPADLVALNHSTYGPAIALGMVLPIRMRWDLAKGRESIRLRGGKLLELGGIRFDERRKSRAFDRLARNLDKLGDVGVLASWEWTSGLPSRSNVVVLRPSEGILDRTIRGVLPTESPSSRQMPITGDELRAWRTARGLTQAELAAELGAGRRSAVRWENLGGSALPASVRQRLLQRAC